nr:hypothetical protein [uncultured Serratia sp.]
MDNKLSELRKPTACRNKHTGRTFNATENTEPAIYENLYSQEYVSAMLAELESSQAIANEYQQLMYHMDDGGDFYEFQRDKAVVK